MLWMTHSPGDESYRLDTSSFAAFQIVWDCPKETETLFSIFELLVYFLGGGGNFLV